MSDAQAAREAWETFGAGYDRAFRRTFTAIAAAALRFADVRPGQRLLDVAAGSGALSIPAARLGAEVLASDLSPGMLELLRAHAESAGVPGIATAVMDGTALELEDETFDRVCSQFGVMLFPDPDAGLREMYRVTAPGGLGLMVIFGRPERVVPVWLFEQATRTALPEIELPPGPPIQTEPHSLREAMADAGFAEVRLETLDETVQVGSASGLWEVMSSSVPGIAMFLSRLPEEHVAAVRDALLEAVVAAYGADVTELPIEVVIGLGHRR